MRHLPRRVDARTRRSLASSDATGRASEPRRSIRAQFVLLLVSRGAGSALQALALVLLARSVEPSSFGIVNAVVGIVGIVLVVTGFGMSLYVPWAHASGDADSVAAGLRLNSWSNFATSVVLVLGLGAWLDLLHGPLGAMLVGLSLALERNVDTLLGVSVADGQTRLSVASMLLRRAVSLCVLVPLLLLGADPVWSYACGLLTGAVAAQLHVRRRVVTGGSPSAVPLALLLRRAWPFMISNLATQARTLDTVVVASVISPVGAGLYSSASKLVQPFLLIPQTLAGVVMPRSTKIDAEAARRLGTRLALISCLAVLPVLPVVHFGDRLVVLVMGPRYAGAGAALGWAIVGLPFMVLAASLGAVLQGQGRQRLVAANGIAFAVLTLAGAAVGAALGGVTGAAAGLTAGTALRAAVLGWSLSRLGRYVRPNG